MSGFSETDIITILGQRGCGKSTLGRTLARHFPRLIVIDRLKEWSAARDNITLTERFDTYAEYVLRIAREGLSEYRLGFQFDVEQDNKGEVFSEVIRLAYKLGNCCILVEECHHFASPVSIDKWLFECTMTGRHQNIGMILSSQRAAQVHKGLISQSEHVFVGQHFEARDIEYLRSCIGDESERVRTLPKFHFLHYLRGRTPSPIVTTSPH